MEHCEFCGSPVTTHVDMIIGGREHAVGLCGGCEESKDIIAEEPCKPLYGENNPYFKLFVKYGGGLPWICKKADYKKE